MVNSWQSFHKRARAKRAKMHNITQQSFELSFQFSERAKREENVCESLRLPTIARVVVMCWGGWEEAWHR